MKIYPTSSQIQDHIPGNLPFRERSLLQISGLCTPMRRRSLATCNLFWETLYILHSFQKKGLMATDGALVAETPLSEKLIWIGVHEQESHGESCESSRQVFKTQSPDQTLTVQSLWVFETNWSYGIVPNSPLYKSSIALCSEMWRRMKMEMRTEIMITNMRKVNRFL